MASVPPMPASVCGTKLPAAWATDSPRSPSSEIRWNASPVPIMPLAATAAVTTQNIDVRAASARVHDSAAVLGDTDAVAAPSSS